MTISEFYENTEMINEPQISVEGTVATGSVRWDDDSQTLSFSLTDGNRELSVSYQGTAPESFKPGNEMTVAGRYRRDGVFTAVTLESSRPVCAACH